MCVCCACILCLRSVCFGAAARHDPFCPFSDPDIATLEIVRIYPLPPHPFARDTVHECPLFDILRTPILSSPFYTLQNDPRLTNAEAMLDVEKSYPSHIRGHEALLIVMRPPKQKTFMHSILCVWPEPPATPPHSHVKTKASKEFTSPVKTSRSRLIMRRSFRPRATFTPLPSPCLFTDLSTIAQY